MSVTFEVDQVRPATKPVPDGPLPTVFGRVAGRTLVSCTDVDASLLTQTTVHPLAAAVHYAFSEHRPLILSPDVVWLTIAQGFAQHVNANAETLRRRFVRHEGRRTLTCPVRSLETHEDWAAAIDGFCELVADEVEPGIADLVRCDFSTTTPVTRVAGDIVLLDAFQRYFVYEMMLICGIPEVTLLGSLEDWRKIEARVEALAEYDLHWWTEWLAPVCREMRRTVEGSPDLDFWQSIYMPEEVYGGEIVTGWIARFFPYLETVHERVHRDAFEQQTTPEPSVFKRNPGLATWKPPSEDQWLRRGQTEPPVKSRRRWLCEGVRLKRLPLGLSRVPVRITGPAGEPMCDIQLLAGFVGVTQTESLAVQPHIGWGVFEGVDEVHQVVRF